jgi:hypothetical protein
MKPVDFDMHWELSGRQIKKSISNLKATKDRLRVAELLLTSEPPEDDPKKLAQFEAKVRDVVDRRDVLGFPTLRELMHEKIEEAKNKPKCRKTSRAHVKKSKVPPESLKKLIQSREHKRWGKDDFGSKPAGEIIGRIKNYEGVNHELYRETRILRRKHAFEPPPSSLPSHIEQYPNHDPHFLYEKGSDDLSKVAFISVGRGRSVTQRVVDDEKRMVRPKRSPSPPFERRMKVNESMRPRYSRKLNCARAHSREVDLDEIHPLSTLSGKSTMLVENPLSRSQSPKNILMGEHALESVEDVFYSMHEVPLKPISRPGSKQISTWSPTKGSISRPSSKSRLNSSSSGLFSASVKSKRDGTYARKTIPLADREYAKKNQDTFQVRVAELGKERYKTRDYTMGAFELRPAKEKRHDEFVLFENDNDDDDTFLRKTNDMTNELVTTRTARVVGLRPSIGPTKSKYEQSDPILYSMATPKPAIPGLAQAASEDLDEAPPKPPTDDITQPDIFLRSHTDVTEALADLHMSMKLLMPNKAGATKTPRSYNNSVMTQSMASAGTSSIPIGNLSKKSSQKIGKANSTRGSPLGSKEPSSSNLSGGGGGVGATMLPAPLPTGISVVLKENEGPSESLMRPIGNQTAVSKEHIATRDFAKWHMKVKSTVKQTHTSMKYREEMDKSAKAGLKMRSPRMRSPTPQQDISLTETMLQSNQSPNVQNLRSTGQKRLEILHTGPTASYIREHSRENDRFFTKTITESNPPILDDIRPHLQAWRKEQSVYFPGKPLSIASDSRTSLQKEGRTAPLGALANFDLEGVLMNAEELKPWMSLDPNRLACDLGLADGLRIARNDPVKPKIRGTRRGHMGVRIDDDDDYNYGVGGGDDDDDDDDETGVHDEEHGFNDSYTVPLYA